MASRIHGRGFIKALTDAGILREGDYVSRVVIDIDVDGAVTLTIERFGDERLYSLIPALTPEAGA